MHHYILDNNPRKANAKQILALLEEHY